MDHKDAIKLLPGQIKVRVREDYTGSLVVTPVSDRIKDLISATNQYDGSYSIHLQFSQDIMSFLEDYPKSRYRVPSNSYGEGYKIGRYTYEINNGAVFLIDSWDYRHMVGGQSD